MILFLLYTCCSLMIFWQDLKSRSIHLYLILFFALLPVFFHFLVRPIDPSSVVFNWVFLAVAIGLSMLVIRWRNHLSFSGMFGLGDVLYLMIVSVYFDFPDFVIWLNIGLMAALGIHLMAKRFSEKYKKRNLIPLAGFLTPIFTVALYIDIHVGPVSAYFF
ncbi:hypothetical protein [Marinoscillum sp.]|uniref:hypothetical protein n=2 Tax=Marinoscillum sp. TaxID=2024838 RepID=UPI003300F23B